MTVSAPEGVDSASHAFVSALAIYGPDVCAVCGRIKQVHSQFSSDGSSPTDEATGGPSGSVADDPRPGGAPSTDAASAPASVDSSAKEPNQARAGSTEEPEGDAPNAAAVPPPVPGAASSERCNRCGGANVAAWSAASPLWNLVMRGNDIDGTPLNGDLVCIPCFIALATEMGVLGSWRLTVAPEPDGLVLTTPSGRTWDSHSFAWLPPTAGEQAPEPSPSPPAAPVPSLEERIAYLRSTASHLRTERLFARANCVEWAADEIDRLRSLLDGAK